MFSAFINAFKVKDIRNKLLFTVGIIALCRITSSIPCPGVDTHALSIYFKQFSQTAGAGMMFGVFNLFTGGALQKFAIATLGIMPYITASIIMQMISPVIPQFEKMLREEGESGRQKFNQYTRYLTLLLCIVQGSMAAYAMVNPQRIGLPAPTIPLVSDSGPYFVLMTIIILTCGTMFLMWLGEKITDNGIGNGASIIISIGIISRIPRAIYSLYEMLKTGGFQGQSIRPVHVFLLILLFVLVASATIILTQAQRRIPIQYAKRMLGQQAVGGKADYFPIRVNFSGVMPIILAGAILMFLSMFFSWIPPLRFLSGYVAYGTSSYIFIYGIMVVFFAFFWVVTQFKPPQYADALKRNNAFIPGIRPGKPTADYLDNTMTRVTLIGALFLTALAILPMIMYKQFNTPYLVAKFFGGTSLLIMVGTILDALSQLEAHLIMRNYDGFMKKGRLQGRYKRT